ncbi:MAG TPA: hypothetical protein VE174_10160 [Actinomycetota bacterium]|nr:hypothetical protein [Actinomycetota bacterium]
MSSAEVRDAKTITKREASGSALLWFGVLGGPAAWVVQLSINYSLEEWFACSPGSATSGLILGMRVPAIAFVVTGALAALALAAGIVSVGCFRKTRGARDSEVGSRARWMALAGIMNSVLYFIIILASFGPPILLGVCESSP